MTKDKKSTKPAPVLEAAPTEMVPSEYIHGRYRWVYYSLIAIALFAACYGLVAYRHHHQPVAYDDKGYIVLPTLGIKFQRTAAMKDWTFRADPNPREKYSVYLETPQYKQKIHRCLTGSGNGPTNADDIMIAESVGHLISGEGQYDDPRLGEQFHFDDLINQFNGFFISAEGFGNPAVCQTQAQNKELESITQNTYVEVRAAVQGAQQL